MIKRYFFTGLAILLPVVLTLFVVFLLVNLLTRPFMGFAGEFLGQHELISKLLILVFLFGVTLAVGILARRFFLHYLFRLGDVLIHKIPIVNQIYRAFQDVVHTLFSTDKGNFAQVVLVPFPYEGVYSLGMITSEALSEQEERISVFVPATPNPTMGFMLMLKRSQLIFLDMKVDDALKAVISCGVVFKI